MRKKLLVVYNPRLSRGKPVATELAQAARAIGADCRVLELTDDQEVRSHAGDADIVLALGGDGTILRVARLTLQSQVPVVGVNLGELGFLAEVNPEEAVPALPELMSGGGWIEERMVLEAAVWPQGGAGQPAESHVALNDAVVCRGGFTRVIRAETRVNGAPFTTYFGDGLLVCTPTGSTAYNLAASGPILDPALDSLVLTPILPYLSFCHPVVLVPGSEVEITVHTDAGAVLTLDGQIEVPLADGHRVLVKAARSRSKFLRLQPRSYFYATLTRRLRQDRFMVGRE